MTPAYQRRPLTGCGPYRNHMQYFRWLIFLLTTNSSIPCCSASASHRLLARPLKPSSLLYFFCSLVPCLSLSLSLSAGHGSHAPVSLALTALIVRNRTVTPTVLINFSAVCVCVDASNTYT
ncbi:hypothetical protein An07g06615 [Aspergillus niger]|uniref:Uncharacterized protein n=2 Tax=Aspergillus niger TaxID=5061 RepID=A2QNQ6_ASPNC|nr:hypothetical protein An07g06615 [Aspergillus niger]CAK39508.1 hypothetical protein An07g06615 [Aspergillus niger]